MERRRPLPVMRMVVVALVLAMGCALLAFAPSGRRDDVQTLASRLRIALPDLSIDRSGGMFHSDELYVSTTNSGGTGTTRPVARLRPAPSGRMRVAMYDDQRRSYGREEMLPMDAAVSRIGLRAYSR